VYVGGGGIGILRGVCDGLREMVVGGEGGGPFKFAGGRVRSLGPRRPWHPAVDRDVSVQLEEGGLGLAALPPLNDRRP
jgi:hypothetical protein